MNEQKYKKAIFICRLVTISSGVLLLILLAVVSRNFYDGMDDIMLNLVEIIMKILGIGIFLPPFIIIGFKQKIKDEKSEARIDALEQEFEYLKNNLK